MSLAMRSWTGLRMVVAAYIHERMPLVPGGRFERSELGRCARATARFGKYLDYFLSTPRKTASSRQPARATRCCADRSRWSR